MNQALQLYLFPSLKRRLSYWTLWSRIVVSSNTFLPAFSLLILWTTVPSLVIISTPGGASVDITKLSLWRAIPRMLCLTSSIELLVSVLPCTCMNWIWLHGAAAAIWSSAMHICRGEPCILISDNCLPVPMSTRTNYFFSKLDRRSFVSETTTMSVIFISVLKVISDCRWNLTVDKSVRGNKENELGDSVTFLTILL